jgi:hypothetical protein
MYAKPSFLSLDLLRTDVALALSASKIDEITNEIPRTEIAIIESNKTVSMIRDLIVP